MMGDVIIPSLANFLLGPDYFCSRLLQVCDSPKFTVLKEKVDIDRILSDKPDKIKKNDFLNKIYDTIAANPQKRKTIKAVHMSDPHVDFKSPLV